MDSGGETFPNDIAALKAALAAARDRHIIEAARAAYAKPRRDVMSVAARSVLGGVAALRAIRHVGATLQS